MFNVTLSLSSYTIHLGIRFSNVILYDVGGISKAKFPKFVMNSYGNMRLNLHGKQSSVKR